MRQTGRSAVFLIVLLASTLAASRPGLAKPLTTPRIAPSRPCLLAPKAASNPAAAYVPPGVSLEEARGAQPRKNEPVTSRWWFWTAVGALVLGTAAVIVIAGQEPSPPGSTLGNMEAFGRR